MDNSAAIQSFIDKLLCIGYQKLDQTLTHNNRHKLQNKCLKLLIGCIVSYASKL